ncbi:DMT family transporter [Denitromonas halophila]|uniref:DMT family transporter n=1 Tax=Denitromonas halophila TaxID=1629404 RepID=A0A557R1T3_9RHOO|nr:DMT family transporter [Denitromonas halophila]TVO59104.1 DMT family transporter [Denitromonas halophila]
MSPDSSVHAARLPLAGLVLGVLAAVGFSFKAILVKLAYRHGVDAETLLALRMLFSLPFFLFMGWHGSRRAMAPLGWRDWRALFLLGLSGYYLASYLDFLGLGYITAALERLILFAYPSIVVILSALFLGKPLTHRTVVALVLCYVGVAFAVAHDLALSDDTTDVMNGSVLVFGSAVAYALYLMGNGQVVGRLGAARVTAWASTVACALSIGQFLLLRPISTLDQPWQVYGLAIAMALFSTVLPIWCVSAAIRRIGAGPVALTGSLGPIVTLGLGAVMLDEAIGVAQLAGGAMVVGGVLVMARGKR